METLPEGDGTRPSPPTNLLETGHLVMGPGAKRDSGGQLTKLTPVQMEAVQKAKKYAMEQSIKMVLMKQTIAHQAHQAKSMQRHQAIVLMCRIYVGSINFEVKEDTIRQAFLPFGPIRNISMSWDPITQRHKGFAFVEFETPEAAQLALEQMNGVIVSGRNIKVGRPSNMPQAQCVIEEVIQEGKDYARIYVASIHNDLTEDDIKSVFEAFGPIKSCELAMTPYPNRHKGYCFIEYVTPQAASDAINSMNLFDLGGQFLRVGRGITPPNTTANVGPPPSTVPQNLPTAAAVAAAAATAKIQAMDAVASNLGIVTTTVTTPAVVPSSVAVPQRGFGPPVASAVPLPPPAVATLPAAPAAPAPPPVAQPEPPVAGRPPGVYVPPASMAAEPQAQISAAVPEATISAEEQKKKQQALQLKLMEGQEISTLQQQENMSIKGQEARHLVMQKLMRDQKESVVVMLKNMVGPEDVDDDLQDEIEEECGKFGPVERVIIYQERQSEEADAPIDVKIFVEFKSSDGATKAKENLNGRFFGGRRVVADIYDQDLYDHNDLSG